MVNTLILNFRGPLLAVRIQTKNCQLDMNITIAMRILCNQVSFWLVKKPWNDRKFEPLKFGLFALYSLSMRQNQRQQLLGMDVIYYILYSACLQINGTLRQR